MKTWIKINECFSTLEEWETLYNKLSEEIKLTGLTYNKNLKEGRSWFIIQVDAEQLSKGWNSFASNYKTLYEIVRNELEARPRRFKLKVAINIDKWRIHNQG